MSMARGSPLLVCIFSVLEVRAAIYSLPAATTQSVTQALGALSVIEQRHLSMQSTIHSRPPPPSPSPPPPLPTQPPPLSEYQYEEVEGEEGIWEYEGDAAGAAEPIELAVSEFYQ